MDAPKWPKGQQPVGACWGKSDEFPPFSRRAQSLGYGSEFWGRLWPLRRQSKPHPQLTVTRIPRICFIVFVPYVDYRLHVSSDKMRFKVRRPLVSKTARCCDARQNGHRGGCGRERQAGPEISRLVAG